MQAVPLSGRSFGFGGAKRGPYLTQVAGTDIDVSLITINYNSAAETIELLKSLKAHRPQGLHVEVLVVDNASRPEDFAQLESYWTTEAGSPVAGDKAPGFAMRLLRSQINLGFSGGNMYGAYAAGGKYLLFLNNDCLVASDIFSPFVDFMQNHQPPAKIAMLGGQSIDSDGKKATSYGMLPTLTEKFFGRGIARACGSASAPPSISFKGQQARAVDLVSGSCMFVEAETFFKLGGLDPSFFLYCEEEDYGKRAKNLGYQIFHLPWITYQHAGSVSTRGSHAEMTLKREFFISFFLYFRKHHGGLTVGILRLFYFFKLLRKNMALAFFALRGAPPQQSLRFQQGREAYPFAAKATQHQERAIENGLPGGL